MVDGDVNVQKTGKKTNAGNEHETFGSGTAAQSEAGKKGAAISAARSEEDRKAAGQKAAETRAQRGTQHNGSS